MHARERAFQAAIWGDIELCPQDRECSQIAKDVLVRQLCAHALQVAACTATFLPLAFLLASMVEKSGFGILGVCVGAHIVIVMPLVTRWFAMRVWEESSRLFGVVRVCHVDVKARLFALSRHLADAMFYRFAISASMAVAAMVLTILFCSLGWAVVCIVVSIVLWRVIVGVLMRVVVDALRGLPTSDGEPEPPVRAIAALTGRDIDQIAVFNGRVLISPRMGRSWVPVVVNCSVFAGSLVLVAHAFRGGAVVMEFVVLLIANVCIGIVVMLAQRAWVNTRDRHCRVVVLWRYLPTTAKMLRKHVLPTIANHAAVSVVCSKEYDDTQVYDIGCLVWLFPIAMPWLAPYSMADVTELRCDSPEWKGDVERLLNQSDMAVFVLGDSPGASIAWELEAALSALPPSRMIVLWPRSQIADTKMKAMLGLASSRGVTSYAYAKRMGGGLRVGWAIRRFFRGCAKVGCE